MFRRVLRRLRGLQSPEESIDSASSDDGPDNSEAWVAPEAKARMLAVARTPAAQPDPPSHTDTPPPEPEAPPPPPPPPLRTEDDRSQQLAVLLAAANDDEEADGIIEQFATPEGRARLISDASEQQQSVEERRDSRRHSHRARRARSEADDLVASDDDETPVIMESIRMNPEQTDGVTTRRGTVVGRNKKISETKSVPLTEKRTRKENFIERNRRARMERAVRLSRNPKEDKAPPRRSTRLRRIAELEEADCSDSDQSSAHSDCSMRSTGSAGANDEINSDSDADADEAAPDTDSDAAEEEAIAAVVEEESEEEDEDFVIKRKRTKGASSKRPPAGSNRRSSGRLRNKRKPAQSPSKDFLGRRKKTKRRRTDPNSVFESPQTFLTAEERRERLEALVKQTADIARDLNAAMTAEKERDEAAAVALAAGGTGRVVKKKISEGELFWPTGPGLSMQPHQIDGVRWLLTLDSQGLNAILADEMGLGKTIQSITFLATILSVENRGPHIIIAPKNVVPHWATEVETWYPGKFKVVTHIGAGEERFVRMTEVLRTIPDFDILVTTFDLAIRDFFTKPRPESALSWQNRHVIRSMQKLEFEYAVVDEAHRLKNTEAKFTSGLRKFTQARRRLLLTGTPLSNNLQELWALMNVLNPRIFGSQGTFDAWFAAPFDTSDKRNSLSINEQSLIVDRLHTVLRPFFRRRLRADVCPSFSSADEVVIRCPQSALQKALSAHYRRDRKNRDLSVNNIVMQLRKIANHPYIVSGALFELSAVETPRGLVGPCGKFLFLYHVLPRLIAAGHRVLIFSQFRRVLDFIEDLLDMLKFKYGRLDGDTTNEDRENTVANFNKPGCDVPIFLLTTRAGGVGLNLQSADTVILFDSDWNPSADLQAVSRIQRIGQKRTVHIMRLVTDNSIDEVIVERGRDKLRTEAVAVGAGKFNANVDPAADSAMRQRDLEQILAEYEARQNKRSSPDAAPVPIRGRDDPAGVKAPATSVIMKECFERWEPQLLRNGETGLPSFEGTVQPLIESPETVPEWIRIGCNARCASLALKCQQPAQVPAALEKGRLQNAQNDGALPTKRERRARFNFKGVYDGLSADDESEFEGPNASQESSGSDSDVQFVPDELTARIKSRARLVPKSETVPVQYPSMQPYNYMPPNGYTAPVTGAGFGRITADMMALNNPVQANGYVAPIVQGAFDPVPVQMGQGPTVIVTRDPSLAGPRPIAPRSVQIPPVAPISVLPPPGMIPQPTFAPNGVYMGHPPVMPRQVGTSPTGIPIIDLNTDSDDDAFQSRPLAQGPAKKSSNLQAVAKAEKVRPRPTQPTEMQKARARKNEMAKERTQALEVAKEAYAKAKAQAVATGKTHVPAQVLSKSPVVGQSAVQENRAQSVATAPAPATSRVLAPAQTSVQSHDQKFSAVAPQPGAVASAANLAASSLAAVGATESDHGVDPKLITSLQHFTGVLDRGLLADVLVQCNNDLAMAANYILTCE